MKHTKRAPQKVGSRKPMCTGPRRHCNCRFIKALLGKTFGDQRMREELWGLVLLEKLQTAYHRAKKHAGFLLDIEVNGRPSTYSHYFTNNLQKSRSQRLKEALDKSSGSDGWAEVSC